MIARLKAGEVLRSGRLGIQPKPANADGSGVTVAQLLPDGPAAKAGLQAGDQLLEVGGQKVQDAAQLKVLLGGYLAGDKIKLRLKRGEEELKSRSSSTSVRPPPAGQPAAAVIPAEKPPESPPSP